MEAGYSGTETAFNTALKEVPGHIANGDIHVTAEQKTAWNGSVRYDAAQSLTDAQKQQARANIAAAPAGYGLGGNGTEVSDWNNATKNGFYRDAKGTEEKHSPFIGVWSCGYVTTWSSGALVQVAFGFPYVNGKYVKCEKNRGYANGGWGEWEWVNPPMQLGVEYRTTERYFGKPVYAKTIDCGTVPLNTQKTVSMEVSGRLNKIRCNAWANSSSDAFTIPRKLSGTEVTVTAASSANNIYISSNTDTLANYTIYATVYYTKATD